MDERHPLPGTGRPESPVLRVSGQGQLAAKPPILDEEPAILRVPAARSGVPGRPGRRRGPAHSLAGGPVGQGGGGCAWLRTTRQLPAVPGGSPPSHLTARASEPSGLGPWLPTFPHPQTALRLVLFPLLVPALQLEHWPETGPYTPAPVAPLSSPRATEPVLEAKASWPLQGGMRTPSPSPIPARLCPWGQMDGIQPSAPHPLPYQTPCTQIPPAHPPAVSAHQLWPQHTWGLRAPLTRKRALGAQGLARSVSRAYLGWTVQEGTCAYSHTHRHTHTQAHTDTGALTLTNGHTHTDAHTEARLHTQRHTHIHT